MFETIIDIKLNNCEAYTYGKFQNVSLRIENGLIREISNAPFDGGVDLRGKRVLPGIVDIHTHGCAGFDFSNCTPADMGKMCEWYASKGVTSVLATTITMPNEHIEAAILRISQAARQPRTGAKICGINLEGPYLNPTKKGAHDARFLTAPDTDGFARLQSLSGGIIKIVDIDPTADAGFIERHSKNCVVSIAHTPADWDCASRAFERGASHVTHLFNAMTPFGHREPGVLGAFIDHAPRGANAELIVDGFHVHPSAVRMVFKAAAGHIALISDSAEAAGMPDGAYELGGLPVLVSGGKVVLADSPETLAGSAANAFDCMKNAIRFGVDECAAISAATDVPAKIIGINAGKIERGRAADLLVCDKGLNLEKVYVCE